MSSPTVLPSSATDTASSATATDSTGNGSSRSGNNYASCAGGDCGNLGFGLGPISVKSIFYFIGFLGLVIALFYTIFVVRRRRRRNNRRNDPEMAERRGNTTYRPDSGDEVSPPQYRAYMLDQPYTDPGTAIVYPDSVHYGTEQGLIQHIAVLEQQERSQRTSAADQDSIDEDDDIERPMLTTTMTTTTTTTTTTTVVAPAPRSSTTAPTAGTTGTALEGETESASPTTATITEPAPAHAQTFFSGRHLSILRMGLSNYSHNHSRSSSRSSSSASVYSNSSNGSRSTTSQQQQRPAAQRRQMWTNPAQYTESYMIIDRGTSTATPNSTTNNSANDNGTSESSDSPLAVVMPPTLYRLRSMGPPPYIPTSDDEEAPALPPSYNVVVDISSASAPTASTPAEIAAH
ncbi:hypothetical protein BGZ96_002039 [Linnemannia gamsii]|uniref:Uncharacterized protein n=1 Tax=Linnemannia gamsii TaxID=64522 RepID=A0ABQ7JLE3_9FUNG|nr:hypothetical protein BGZ96_002039 [Linnemannia gamsii]